MITKNDAVKLVTDHINASYSVPGDCLVVLEEQTIEREYGWTFFFNSKRYLETGKFSYRLAGNSPILVDKDDGSLHFLGTALPVEESLKQYEAEWKTSHAG